MDTERIAHWLRRTKREPTLVVVPLVAGIAGVIGSFAVAGLTPGFVAAPISGFLARTLPAAVITAAILFLGSLGQALNLVTAIVLSALLFALVTAVARYAASRVAQPLVAVGGAGISVAGLAFLLTGGPLPAAGAGVAVSIVVGVDHLASRPESSASSTDTSAGRRRLLASLATLASVGVLGTLYRQAGAGTTSPSAPATDSETRSGTPSAGSASEETPVSPEKQLLTEADEKSLDIRGIEPLVSEKFYQVDINAVDPELSPDGWTLSITGAVEEERTLSYEDLTNLPEEHRFITLRCVGENLNGHKMDNALWTGTPVADLIDGAGPMGGCECVMLRAEDGYFEEFPLSALRNGFLAWGMNGGPLPKGHGHPVRALIPGHWGEINVKWLTEIEVLDKQVDGYWEKRGWHGTGPVNTVAKLHAFNDLENGRLQVGGHAYAGTRGIDRVEVSIDGGDSWVDATLSEPLPGEDVWRQWVYEYDNPGSTHEVVVRATDGTGTLQPEEQQRSFPSGPTGWVRQRMNPP